MPRTTTLVKAIRRNEAPGSIAQATLNQHHSSRTTRAIGTLNSSLAPRVVTRVRTINRNIAEKPTWRIVSPPSSGAPVAS
jgi:hypothetical protein